MAVVSFVKKLIILFQLNPYITSMSAEHEYEFKSKLGEGQDASCVTDE